MKYSEVNTIILVDDRDSTHKGGGFGSPERRRRYEILLAVLKGKLKELRQAYLILGDGTFELLLSENDNELQPIDHDQIFVNSVNATSICEKIKKLANGQNTLLLVDYMLNNLSGREREGKLLACKILNYADTLDNFIKLLYSTSRGIKKESKNFNWAYVFDFPIDSPTDAADEILWVLKKRGDLDV